VGGNGRCIWPRGRGCNTCGHEFPHCLPLENPFRWEDYQPILVGALAVKHGGQVPSEPEDRLTRQDLDRIKREMWSDGWRPSHEERWIEMAWRQVDVAIQKGLTAQQAFPDRFDPRHVTMRELLEAGYTPPGWGSPAPDTARSGKVESRGLSGAALM
jgi:hypothetical protein